MFGFIFQHHGSHMDYRKMWSPTPILGTGQQVIASMVEELEASEATWADLGDLVEIYHWVKRPFSWGNRDLKPWDFCETAFSLENSWDKAMCFLCIVVYILYIPDTNAVGALPQVKLRVWVYKHRDANFCWAVWMLKSPICVAQIPTFWRWRSLCLNMSS